MRNGRGRAEPGARQGPPRVDPSDKLAMAGRAGSGFGPTQGPGLWAVTVHLVLFGWRKHGCV